MKVCIYISFNSGHRCWDDVAALMHAAGCTEMAASGPNFLSFYGHTFDQDDPRLARLRSQLRAAGIIWSERCEHTYANSELRAAPLLLFSVSTGERDIGPRTRDQFDWSTGCPRCGAGARQIAPLRIKSEAQWHRGLPAKAVIYQTLEGEYVVMGALYEALASAELVGLGLLQLVSAKGKPVPWWQILPRHVMPRMASETRGIVRGRPGDGCRQCDRDNYFGTPAEPAQIAYRRSHLGTGSLPDVTETWECFGLSSWKEGKGGLARGHVLVSSRVFDIFRKLRVRAAHFDPVRVLDD